MYNSDLNLNQYKIFYDVAKYGSVSLASKNLNISQPAISRSIKNLENDLGVVLFYRTLNGMILTEKGSTLLKYVEDACNSLIIGERLIKEDNTNSGIINMGISNDVNEIEILNHIKKYHEDYPNMIINIIRKDNKELLKLLTSHELDFIIGIFNNYKDLKCVNYTNDKYVCVSNKEYNINKLNNNINIVVNKNIKNNISLKNNNIIYMDDANMIKNYLLNSNDIGILPENYVKNTNLKILPSELINSTNNIDILYDDKYILNNSINFINKYLIEG